VFNVAINPLSDDAAVVTKEAAGNRKLDKSKATGRIDGLVPAGMTVSAMSAAPGPEAPPKYQMIIFGQPPLAHLTYKLRS
jgi:hypothetical protein